MSRLANNLIQLAILCTAVAVILVAISRARRERPDQTAARILQESSVHGGLIVHLGCGDGRLTAALRADDRYLVHGLDSDPANIEQARQHIRARRLYGKVTAETWPGGRLPYADNLVNLIVAEDLAATTMDEVLRVLVPQGVACVKRGDEWTKTVKPRPAEIDEWTHFLHDAGNNAVAQDKVVGPPQHLQWVAEPTWARSHDHLATISAVVSASGRVFSIVDEGPAVAVVLQPKWTLVARDAFNGVLLWKRPIGRWRWHLQGFRSGPSDLARRLVAVGDRVYATLDINGPVSVLDAATGKTLATYRGTEGAREIIYLDGLIFVVAAAPEKRTKSDMLPAAQPGLAPVRPQRPEYIEEVPPKRIVAIEAASGRTLWTKADAETAETMPTTLAAAGDRVFFQNAEAVFCLDARSGKWIWQAERQVARRRPTWSSPTLVVCDDVVLSADRALPEKKNTAGQDGKVQWIVSSTGGNAPPGDLVAFSVANGRELWSCQCREGYNSPVDVLVADGLVWTGDVVHDSSPGITQGRDLHTGAVRRTRPADQTFAAAGFIHSRCHRSKATCRYLVVSRAGSEFIDLTTGNIIANYWARGECQYGVMPCNGLLYGPSHSCACFTTAKLNGFNCLAPKRASQAADSPDGDRLQRGPAYGQIQNPKSEIENPNDWTTYRHDPARSGATRAAVSSRLEKAWQTTIGGKLSAPVVAEGKLLVAEVDAHTVHALDTADGRRLWSFTAGGRIDSPPTVWQGRVLFGSDDGYVYCLRAADGRLAWRFRAAPKDLRIVAYGQLESAWPVPGSVLVHDGIACFAAGRSSYLEGGIRLCRLDAKSGEMLSETVIDDRDPQTGYQRQGAARAMDMPGALPDVLSCDGDSLYLRHARFDLAGNPQPQTVPHLYSSVGFLDDAWWHRTYWLIGTKVGTNYGGWPEVGNRVPAGRLLVVDGQMVYGFGRNQYIHHGAHVGIDGATIFHFNPTGDADRRFTFYRAFAMDQQHPLVPVEPPADPKAPPPRPVKKYLWTAELPLLARAMVLAGDNLCMAGPPDIFTSDDPQAAWEGRRGGLLRIVGAADGCKRAEYPLASPPVFDGLIAAGGRLFMATVEGRVIGFGGEE